MIDVVNQGKLLTTDQFTVQVFAAPAPSPRPRALSVMTIDVIERMSIMTIDVTL